MAARTRRGKRRATASARRATASARRTRKDSLAAGSALRSRVPRQGFGQWTRPVRNRDPIVILKGSNAERLPELVPIRFGRMMRSPFTFLRGSAGLMAHDLARIPTTGIRVQACGDCHLLNFGLFATPERRLVIDINDFDETLPAPWEWDVMRLATSVVVAARDNHFSDAKARDSAIGCVRAYREHLREFSRMSPLEVWYAHFGVDDLVRNAPDAVAHRRRAAYAKAARARVAEHLFPKIATRVGGGARLVDQPPLLYHFAGAKDSEARAHESFAAYRESLPDERRVLLDRYRLEDYAIKVVGIGSVGMRCYVALLLSEEGQPLLLQFKEACRSVLEPYAGKSAYANQGRRVVVGQRLMQSSSDIFLGWARGPRGYDFYVRQLRDMKLPLPVERFPAEQLERYGEVCGMVLARAHAKAGDAATISGYLGKSDKFERAIGAFSIAYADQTERDHAALVAAAHAGRIEAVEDER